MVMAPTPQALAHRPQPTHFSGALSWANTARSPFSLGRLMDRQEKPQESTHMEQAVHSLVLMTGLGHLSLGTLWL